MAFLGMFERLVVVVKPQADLRTNISVYYIIYFRTNITHFIYAPIYAPILYYLRTNIFITHQADLRTNKRIYAPILTSALKCLTNAGTEANSNSVALHNLYSYLLTLTPTLPCISFSL